MSNDTIKNEGEGEVETNLDRRSALLKLGLLGLAAYSAPLLANLSDAEAGGRRRKKTKKSKKSRKSHGSKKSRKSHGSKKSGKSRKSRKSGRHS
jgi:hypothetical protein